jgi:hypothetical protein
MTKKFLAVLAAVVFFASCDNDEKQEPIVEAVVENPGSFKEIGTLTIGGTGAAEISAYDETTKKLFTVNNSTANKIDVIDLSVPEKPVLLASFEIPNGAANSLAVYNGKLAVAYESKSNKQQAGKVVVFDCKNYILLKDIAVGALPDMVTYSPDGKFILTANEGEPNDTYTLDPIGSVSVIDVVANYQVTNLDFESFSSQLAALRLKGFVIANPTNAFGADIEPEYVTVSSDSKTAWVTLQENNGIAKIDLVSKKIIEITPLGFKNYNTAANAIDISDRDGGVKWNSWNVKGVFQPDAISNFEVNGVTYLVTANEGDAREYTAWTNVRRLNNSLVLLDPTVFPNPTALKADTSMGRLNINFRLGDIDGDGDLDELYSFGGRSFSIWNSATGALVYDSGNDLDKRSFDFGLYDDLRSDDKGAEPEAVVVTKMGNKQILFVGLERTDALMIYDVTNPASPVFLQTVKTGDAPEGLLFIPAEKSPNKRSLMVISSEGDGSVKIFQPSIQ